LYGARLAGDISPAFFVCLAGLTDIVIEKYQPAF